ncbi:NAD(P)H-dependent flavin oxidoreductase [Microbulbifer spongiae]|uniref:Nitronate monooxygenase n=1 Tax=Microbulbifer spongiae TaxID=2944933 RepID=A0ABY9EI52_9GAMM|nr:nitronate monooxygenase [Microbulbifer sp. MI-G]WKD51524.1 nitronate monooxygenase [Microbulbifer sp. MI-G]
MSNKSGTDSILKESESKKLKLPIIQAPMFLVSGPEMVLASCESGIVGSFPAPNARTLQALDSWLHRITETLTAKSLRVPWAVNLIMHRSNSRRHEELALAVEYRAPLVITALGSPREAVDRVHSYGGKVYADVVSLELARKAAASGVDGLALVCTGAGGHTGHISPFAFVEEVRGFFDGEIILSGAIGSGRAVRAAQVLGADYVYMGTRFIPTHESLAQREYKQMLVDASGADIVTSDAITGVKANWLRNSLIRGGYDPDNMPSAAEIDFLKAAGDAKRWRDIWSAGQGVGAITQIQSIGQVVEQLTSEYQAALSP